MRGLSFNGVLSTTLLGLWMFFKVSCEQSVLITGENSTTVTTISGPFAEDSESVSNATWPYPILWLNATTINTTVVVLHWHRPQGYQQGYSNRVETSGCTSAPRNQTEQDSMATITGLTPGTNCSFTVYSQVQNGIEGEPISVYQYTKPERVSPTIPNRGTSDTIEVTWLSPPGNVEKYKVNLTSNYGDNQTKFLNSSFQSWLFSGLAAGRNYTVVVTTISGPFAEDSEPVSNATYPNPPGAIHAEGQTTDSITISWGRPQGMDLGQYSFIIFCQPHQNGQNESTNNTAVLENLTSGTLYNISVVTVGPMGYHSSAATAGIYTRPYPILGLNATTINTTVVVLHWHSPQGYQQGYSYRVETSCCMPTPRNQTEQNSMATITDQNSMATITDLIPGTNCSFTVYSQVQNGIEGEPISVYQYTKPERVSPTIPNRGANDTIEVTWLSPTSNVEKYKVNLTSNYGDNQIKFLRSSFQSWLFSGLAAGRNYTAVVTTISGPFAEDSEPVSNATYPNPPGAIHAEGQTTDSITISWGRPQGMDLGQYSFIIFCHPHQNGQNESTNNTAVLENLTSGTLYNISVVTVGPMGYHSSAATAGIYTRPYPILGLNATTINTTVVVLHWHSPQGYQQGYSYRVETSCCMPTPRNQTEQNSMATITDQNSMATITDLIPGTNCSFTVYSQVQNGIEGEPISVYQYTKPERVSPTIPNRGANDTIEVTWLSPTSNVEKYKVNLTSNYGDNQIKFLRSSFQSWLFSGLAAGRNYTAVVTTISGPFAEDSEPVSNATYPNPPGAIHAEGQTTDSITISWGWPQGMDLGQYSFIIFYQASQNETTNNTAVLENLTSGTLYNISVVTVGPMGYHSSAATAGIYTRPYPILGLNATTINTTVVVLHWHRPQGYQLGYSYRVETSCCMPTPRNQTEKNSMATITEQNSMATITDLIPGINCSFTVYSQVQNGVEGEPISVYQYTKPERVSPAVSNRGTNDTIEVTWKPPLGNVEKYMVNLTSNYGDNQSMVVSYIVPSPLFSGLTPGRKYTVVVTTISGPFAEDSEPVSCATWPYPILGLNATTINTTVVVLHWHRPQGYQQGYSYMVKTSGCTSAPRNQTEQDSMATITGLTPGTNCSFTVYSQVQNGIEGEPISVYQYTKPERVSPAVSSRGTNDTIEVTWRSPRGNVEKYMVNLTSNYGDNQIKFLRSSFQSQLFSGLAAGRKYTVVVTTISGPFAEDSEPVSNATYPNPPGAIHAEGQTTDSITISWGRPQGMDLGQYSFIIFYQPHQNGQTESTNNTAVLGNLTSGTLYNISVVTVGPIGYHSSAATAGIYTRPYPILGLNATTINTTVVVLHWHRPQGYQLGYSYRVETSCCMPTPRNQTEKNSMATITDQNSMATITDLIPGTNCSFTVYSQVQNAIEGEPISVYQYTKPERVSPAVSNRGTNDTIEVTWMPPLGNVEKYMVNLTSNYGDNQSVVVSYIVPSPLFSGLTPGRKYTVVVTTISGPFAEDSEPVSNATYPNPPGAIHAEEQTTDSITISWGRPQGMDLGQYSFIIFCQPHQNGQNESTNNTAVLENLTSGTLYNISVVTVGPMGYHSSAATAGIYTRPYPILGLNATTINTTVVVLHWHRPQGYQQGYLYRVETSGCTSAPRNQTEQDSMATITGLTPGTNCSFTVYSQVQNGIEGEPISVYQYTKPERVNPAISNRGANDTIEVTWMPPPSNVEKYMLSLTSNYGNNQTKFLNSSFQSWLFSGLAAGRKYTVVVTTISGPFAEDSEPVSNATYPNAPGPITVTNKTTNSVAIEWTPAPGMDRGSFSYHVTYGSSAHDLKSRDTDLNELTVRGLVSGTPYNISVATVGLFQYASQPVLRFVTTRPESVRGLQQSSTTVDMISIAWQRPVGFKPGYSYGVTVRNSTGHLIRDGSTSQLSHNWMGLSPGNRYTFGVTSRTSDGTPGSPVTISVCTDASPVVIFKCDGPNRTGPVLNLAWDSPEGANKGFSLTWGDTGSVTLPPCTGNCRHNIENLSYYTRYQVRITTLGCGETSSVHKTDCQTGITAPPEPSRSTGFAVREKKHNMFVLKFNSSILNSKNGPIVAYGILMTSNLKEFSNENNVGLQKYLNKTHDDWTKDESVPYLATALDTNVEQTRNEKSEFEVNIGSGSRWNGYTNGPLSARTTYRFALVMFTYVALANELVDASRSLFSISKFFDEDVALPENPTVITVGALAGALSAVTCFTAIAAGVYWKKATRKTPSDIPIESMRAKVGAPVRVEDYEAYHRRQSANSNCGFAEEYEELKPVGIGQCKVSAEALENKGKNRYTNVLPYESSRVKLSIQGSPYDDYINASYVPGYNCKKEFIAAQGPLPGTVDEFWRMLWEKNVRTLVMLTRCNEQGRVKCEEYWPSRTKHFKNIFVTTTSVVPLEDWTVRDFDVKNVKTAETRSLRQFHFTAWPDHGVPESTELLIDFRHLVREHMDLVSRNSPTVVHCSAGVGRTGTMIAIDHLLFQIERDSMVDLYGTVYSMRMHRALMVQTEDQYVFLHKCALDIIKSRTGTNVDLIYQNVAAVDIYENVTTIKGAAGVSRP
ncbi:receptor-type tyrosine-protein phosphatase eta-like isoform X10 [Anguilla anguilla]|uniref:receptor-type tyrosine-protein phosphatase eta-like isoform X10 n=1 Tax=Anguilla anguilla TaxID=7936 RepID=UPI0015B06082|nr:receptor-type tyrosine-protein phosphatase eta-like isoform X10 [Anguilla anguilla]